MKKLFIFLFIFLLSGLSLGAACTKQEPSQQTNERRKCAEIGEVCFGFEGLDCCTGKCEDLSSNPDQGGICK